MHLRRDPLHRRTGVALALAMLCGAANADVVSFKFLDQGAGSFQGAVAGGGFLRPGSFDCGDVGAGAGVCSSVRHRDGISTFLPVPGSLPEERLGEFGGEAEVDEDVTQTPGQTVGAFASIDSAISVGPVISPVRARTEFFANHLEVSTSKSRFFFDDRDQPFFRIDYQSSGDAASTWYDTWTASVNAPISLDFRLDGTASAAADPCANQLCGFTFPPGINGFFFQNEFARLAASLTVFDLDTLVLCESQFGDDCDGEFEIQRVVAHVGANLSFSGQEDDDIVVDITDSIAFDVIAGHRYLVISEVTGRAQDGGKLDFMNTYALTGFHDPLGAIQSAAEQTAGARLPGRTTPTGVPAPTGSGLLWLAGALALIKLRREQRAVRST